MIPIRITYIIKTKAIFKYKNHFKNGRNSQKIGISIHMHLLTLIIPDQLILTLKNHKACSIFTTSNSLFIRMKDWWAKWVNMVSPEIKRIFGKAPIFVVELYINNQQLQALVPITIKLLKFIKYTHNKQVKRYPN